jgi:hypothetical protein
MLSSGLDVLKNLAPTLHIIVKSKGDAIDTWKAYAGTVYSALCPNLTVVYSPDAGSRGTERYR